MSRTALAGFPRGGSVRSGVAPVNLGTHPSLAANAAPAVVSLKWHDGQVVIGYGDWTTNTGPIDIAAIAPDGTPSVLISGFMTEATSIQRVFDGALWVPAIDSRGAATGVATDWGGTWQVMPVPDMQHTFDVATLDGTDLWLAGTGVTSANTIGPMVLRTADRDAPDWQTIYEFPSSPLRVYALWPDLVTGSMLFGSEADGKAWSWTAGALTETTVFNATDLVVFPSDMIPWGGGVASLKGVMSDAGFLASNPRNIRPGAEIGGVIYGTNILADHYVYEAAGIAGGQIDWRPLLRVEHEARALASDGSSLYVGGPSGEISKAAIPS